MNWSAELAEQVLGEWTRGLPHEDTEALVNDSAGKAVQWVPGEGWLELDKQEPDKRAADKDDDE